ncbi:MAG: histidinol-phosphate transaminase [Syntrophales bacterium]|jgi:histidinol-phosphate aminotransferase|nr:histidinol-phosphate transaminase [Syntrophales bacterium]
MNRFWSAVVHTIQPYVPGEQPKLTSLIKLNTNENPYAPSPKVLEAVKVEAAETLRLYPDPNADRVREAVADYYGLTRPQVFVGNGSDEVLAFAFQGLLKHKKPLLFPDITYSFYPVYCRIYEIDHETVPVTDDLEIRLDDYLRPNGGIIFPNPNAPTGRPVSLSAIEGLLNMNADSVVVVDEAYVDFGTESAVPLIGRFPNLLVVQTLSKARSLAGLRVGFAMGDPGLIEALDRVKNSFNSYPLDRFAISGAVAALEDRAYFEKIRAKIIGTREMLTANMRDLGFEVLPSSANFIFVRHPHREAVELAGKLRERSIIVRHFPLPRIEQYLRITVGTDEQCGTLVSALREILE